MTTQFNTLDPESCRFCVDAIECEEALQPNHLHKLVQKRNSPRIPTCHKCGQLQIYPFGQDKFPAYPPRYNNEPTAPPDAEDYIPSGEEVPHTKRCTKHNLRFQRQVKELSIKFEGEYKP